MAAAAPPRAGVGDAGTVTLPNSLLIGTGLARSLVIPGYLNALIPSPYGSVRHQESAA